MIHLAFALLMSMLTAISPVNGQENDALPHDQALKKREVTRPINNANKDIPDLTDLLMKTGEDDEIKEHLAPAIGLPGPMPVKVRIISKKYSGKNLSEHECILAYEISSTTESKRPFCIYLHKHKILGQDDESQYFLMNLDGHLEKIVTIRSRRDDEGKNIRGSGIPFDQTADSPEAIKMFTAEMARLTKWLHTQRKVSLRSARPNEASR